MNQQPMRIVCATDLLPRSEPAVERAALLADNLQAQLLLLHIVAPSQSERGLEQTLQHAQAKLRISANPPLWHSARLPGTAIRTGNPARLVVDEVANGQGANLLVLGPHRRRPVRDALEGTIVEKVLASRTCAVLMVHAPVDAQYLRVLLALDVSPASAGAIRAAEQWVLREETATTIVHADEPPYQGMLDYANANIGHDSDYVQSWRNQITSEIRHLLRRESDNAARFHIHVEAGHTVRGILRAVDEFCPDLLLMGTRGGGRLHRALLGSVANSVLHSVSCDVMVVPTGTFRAIEARPLAATDSHSPNVTNSSTAGAF